MDENVLMANVKRFTPLIATNICCANVFGDWFCFVICTHVLIPYEWVWFKVALRTFCFLDSFLFHNGMPESRIWFARSAVYPQCSLACCDGRGFDFNVYSLIGHCVGKLFCMLTGQWSKNVGDYAGVAMLSFTTTGQCLTFERRFGLPVHDDEVLQI